jgi:chemotaxis signal transduction protein
MTAQFVIVSADGRQRMIALDGVREIVAMLAISGIEDAKGRFRGVANIRGDTVPIFDLTSPHAPLASSRFIVVCNRGQAPVGVLVDDVQDVVSVSPDKLAERPVGGGRTQRFAQLGDDVVPILDVATFVDDGA